MKLLILYTYNKGLLSGFFQELSERLYADGFEVDNFYLKHKKACFKQDGVSIYGEKRSSYFKNYLAIYRIIKARKPDVVISNFSYINPAVLFGKLLGVKRNIAWFHSAYGHTKPSQLKVWNKSFYLNLADFVLANSKQLQGEMHSVYKVPRGRTGCIPFWTNIQEYEACPKTLSTLQETGVFQIGCPGRLVFDKNQQSVIEALSILKSKTNIPLKLYLAGKGDNQKALSALIEQYGLQDVVVFLGNLSVSEMVAFYKQMDVVVLPSFHEAFGLVLIEAIALGTPVIVSQTFGALNFVDTSKYQLSDFSFNPRDIKELSHKLQCYIDGEGLSTDYFKSLYADTFEKSIIYKQLKSVITDSPNS
ncbi:glycosyltransferase family 4 protein [Winogradskyella rapida]|uniref:Glycosyltransferase family 4 protein n=1 Tax=Winogradskyella rapida TaxID=549701 RepID=A0ABW3KP29_9FLAO